MKIILIVVGVIIATLLSKGIAVRYKKSGRLSDRDAQMKGLKTVFFGIIGVAALGIVSSVIFSAVGLVSRAQKFNNRPQTDINSYLPEGLKTKPVVWKAVGENGGCVYLMGSVHLMADNTLPFPDYVVKAYTDCDTLAVESVPSDESESSDFSSYKLPDNQKIYDVISKDTYHAAKSFLEARGLYFDSFDDYDVNFWYSLAYEAVITGIKNINYTQGVDLYFVELARNDGKQVVAVDSSIENGLPNPSVELTEFMINDLLTDNDQSAEELAEVYINWANGDVDRLTDSGSDGIPPNLVADYNDYQKALTTDRNVVMADSIETIINSGENVFVVVGAAHFAGDNGITALLEQQGYKIERIG